MLKCGGGRGEIAWPLPLHFVLELGPKGMEDFGRARKIYMLHGLHFVYFLMLI
jgi:hypothetical protein